VIKTSFDEKKIVLLLLLYLIVW